MLSSQKPNLFNCLRYTWRYINCSILPPFTMFALVHMGALSGSLGFVLCGPSGNRGSGVYGQCRTDSTVDCRVASMALENFPMQSFRGILSLDNNLETDLVLFLRAAQCLLQVLPSPPPVGEILVQSCPLGSFFGALQLCNSRFLAIFVHCCFDSANRLIDRNEKASVTLVCATVWCCFSYPN